MAKKLSKLLLGLTAAGAAGAGIYYWMKKKNDIESEDDFDDDFEDDDFELDDDLGEVKERGYVHLNPSNDQASDSSKAVEEPSAAEEEPEAEAASEAGEAPEAEAASEAEEAPEAEATTEPQETATGEADAKQADEVPEETEKPADASEEKNE